MVCRSTQALATVQKHRFIGIFSRNRQTIVQLPSYIPSQNTHFNYKITFISHDYEQKMKD